MITYKHAYIHIYTPHRQKNSHKTNQRYAHFLASAGTKLANCSTYLRANAQLLK